MKDLKIKELKSYFETKIRNVRSLKKIKGEASTRNFYRIYRNSDSLIAMVYPEPDKAKTEIDRIVRLTDVYKQYNINVPEVKEILDDYILIQEDLGDTLAQKAFYTSGIEEPKKILQKSADILLKLKDIPISNTHSFLDTSRMKWEMDFFMTNFASHYLGAAKTEEGKNDLQQSLYRMVDHIQPIDTFAHRDFHSRNMIIHKDNGQLYLIDFQDSLVAPLYYDLVSFAYDSYLELKTRKNYFVNYLKQRGMHIDEYLLHTTALQRNIKALGTFGFQVHVRKNLAYKKYIPRTLRHVTTNPVFSRFFTDFS